MKTYLVTGAAGFIGYHTSRALLERGDRVMGVDNFNDYYDPKLKRDRVAQLEPFDRFSLLQADITDAKALNGLFESAKFDGVIHLAAQAGVRYSLKNPAVYIQSNLVGFGLMLEACRHAKVPHLVYASTSSVYGTNATLPFSEHHAADHPVSLYAATKRANELMAHAYAHLYRLPSTGLRFFTVYGPWGRPDMAPMLFSRAILKGETIDVFNHGRMARDFTYVDDIVEGIARVVDQPATPDPDFSRNAPDPASSDAPWRLYNIGNHASVPLNDFISTLEKALGREARRRDLPMQAGDVEATFAAVDDLANAVGFSPKTSLADGIEQFARWYLEYMPG